MALWDIKSSQVTNHPFAVVMPIEVLDSLDAPLMFTFHDKIGGLMLANLCAVGVGMSRYLACRSDERVIAELKAGTRSVRAAIIQPPLWLIDVRPNGEVGSAWQTSEDELPSEAIPLHGALLTEELEAEQLADEKLARFANSDSDGLVAFDGGPVENHEIDSGFYGAFLQRITDWFRGVCSVLGARPPVMRLGIASPSSYAIAVHLTEQATQPGAMFDVLEGNKSNSASVATAKRALDLMLSLMVDEKPNEGALTLVRAEHHLRKRYGEILELISQTGASIEVRTRSSPHSRKLTGMQAGERLRRVRELGYPFMFLEVRGRLIGGHVEKAGKANLDFSMVVEMASGKPTYYAGITDPPVVEKMRTFKFGEEVGAKLRIRDEKQGQSYTLVDIWHADAATPHAVK